MPRRPAGTWDKKSNRYYAKLGPISEKTGKPKAVMLCHEDGRTVAYGDNSGRLAAIDRLLAERGRAEASGRKGPTVAEVIRAYIAWQVERDASERTIKGHHRNLNQFALAMRNGVRYADLPASAITPEHLFWIEDAGAGCIRNVYLSVCACWAWAYSPVRGRTPSRMIPSNPLEKIKRPSPGSRADAVIPWETTRRMLRVARGMARQKNPHDRRYEATKFLRRARTLCVHMIAAHGCRPNEAYGLKWSEVEWDRGIVAVSVERDKGRRPGKAPKRPRRFFVSRRFMQALAALRRHPRANKTWAFALDHRERPPQVGDLIEWWRTFLRPGLIERGIPIPPRMTLYWLRHSAITDAIHGGGNIDVMGQQFGNSGDVIRSTYSHAADSVRRSVAEDMGRARRKRG